MSERDYSKPAQSSPAQVGENTLDIDELQMRQTLGLSGRSRPQSRAQVSKPPKQRHRFVQDGEVQVTHLTGARDNDAAHAARAKIVTLESNLVAEQAARSRAEQAVQAGLAQIHAIETKLAHVELAAKDMLDAERAARERAEAALSQSGQELSAAIAGLDQARLQSDELAAALKQAQLELQKAKEAAEPIIRVAKVKAAPQAKASQIKEPKPVKWWISKSPEKSPKAAKAL